MMYLSAIGLDIPVDQSCTMTESARGGAEVEILHDLVGRRNPVGSPAVVGIEYDKHIEFVDASCFLNARKPLLERFSPLRNG